MNNVTQKISELKRRIHNNFTKKLDVAEKMLHLTVLVKTEMVAMETAKTEFNRLKERHTELKERADKYINELEVLELCVDVCEN
jgi:hypothetical protein